MFQSIMTNSPIVWHRVMTVTFLIDYVSSQVTKNHDHNSNHMAENHLAQTWPLSCARDSWTSIMWKITMTMNYFM